MSDREITDDEAITIGGLTLCEARVQEWCKKGKDGKYHPIRRGPMEEREGWSPEPTLPEKPGSGWNPIRFSNSQEYYEALLKGGPPDLDDVMDLYDPDTEDILDGEMAEVIPIRPQEDE